MTARWHFHAANDADGDARQSRTWRRESNPLPRIAPFPRHGLAITRRGSTSEPAFPHERPAAEFCLHETEFSIRDLFDPFARITSHYFSVEFFNLVQSPFPDLEIQPRDAIFGIGEIKV